MNPFSDIYDFPLVAPNKFNGYVKTVFGFKRQRCVMAIRNNRFFRNNCVIAGCYYGRRDRGY